MVKNLFLLISFLFFIQSSCSNNNSLDKLKFSEFVESFNSLESNSSFNTERMSESFLLNQLKETKHRLSSLRSINKDLLDFEDQIDYKFIESIIVGKEINSQYYKPWKKDPRKYMNFRQISNKINGPGEKII